VIYQNMLEDCDYFLEMINKKRNADSIWPEWKSWHRQGENLNQMFSRSKTAINENDSDETKAEKEYFDKIIKVYDFVCQDYLNDYSNNKGKWPSYIKDWKKVGEHQDGVHVNVYKYSIDILSKGPQDSLLLEYHVDEMPEGAFDRVIHQVVTVTFYLNDNYDGGEICFYDETENKAYKYKPRAGDVTVFPSAAPFYHAVERFQGEDRYFMRIFITYYSKDDEERINPENLLDESFVKSQEDKLNEFVENYTHTITLEFPDKKINQVHGRLIKMDQGIIEIGGEV